MVKLSAELIEQAAQYTNPVRDRELDLRGWFVFSPAVLVSIARSAFVQASGEMLFPSPLIYVLLISSDVKAFELYSCFRFTVLKMSSFPCDVVNLMCSCCSKWFRDTGR